MECDFYFWTKGEVLIWKTYLTNASYAFKSSIKEVRAPAVSPETPHATFEELNFDWRPGCRVALGYKLCNFMDTVAKFTYIGSKLNNSVSGGEDIVINSQPPFSTLIDLTSFLDQSGSVVSAMKAKMHSHLYMPDLELGRHCFVTNQIDLRPFIGLRGFFYKDTFTYIATDGLSATSDPVVFEPADFTTTIHDWIRGIGIRFGVDTLWGFWRGFSVYANGAVSYLGTWSKWRADAESTFPFSHTESLVNETYFGNIQGMSEIALGFQYDWFSCTKRYHLGFNAGYEFLGFLNDTNLLTFTDSTLKFQGVTIGARFDY